MPQTFGLPASTGRKVQLCDPIDAARYRDRFGRPVVPELARANSLYVPAGNMPARGWILLSRADYDLVRGYGTAYQLTIQSRGQQPITFGGLSIVTARCVTTGLSGDPKALYLVELTDARGVLANEWFALPTNSYYNVLAPAYPGLYYDTSLNGGFGGSPWTWSGMIGDVWAQMPILGAFPGLPSAPLSTPTNWNLPGVPAWQALSAMLEHIGMGVACNLTLSPAYSIVSMGGTDAVFDGMTTRYATNLQDDLEPLDIGAARVPGTVIVYFRRVNQQYGTEETVRKDSNQWATASVYSVSVPAPAAFTGAPGTGFIWDDFAVRYDVNNQPLAADVVTAGLIAAERVSQYFDLIYSRTSGAMNKRYAGALPFYAGSQVDGVCWRQDYANGREGWRTQIIRGDLGDVWPGVY
jgi:hypothetical protein